MTCYNKYMSKQILLILFLIPFVAGCLGGKANIYERQKKNIKAEECSPSQVYRTFDYEQGEVEKACKQVLEAYEYKINDELIKYGFLYGQSGKTDSSTATNIFVAPWIWLGIISLRYEEEVSFSGNIFIKPEGDITNVKAVFFREAWDNKGELLRSYRIKNKALYDKFFEDLAFVLSQVIPEPK